MNALYHFLDDCSDIEARSRYLLLSEPETTEILRWVDLLQTGLLALVPGLPDPVPVDVALATNMIRDAWQKSCTRRQEIASDLLSQGENGSLDALDIALVGENSAEQIAVETVPNAASAR